MGSAFSTDFSSLFGLSGPFIEARLSKNTIIIWESTDKPASKVVSVIADAIHASGFEPFFIYNSSERNFSLVLSSPLALIEKILIDNKHISVVMMHIAIASISELTPEGVKTRLARNCGRIITIIWSTLSEEIGNQKIFDIPSGDYRWTRTIQKKNPELLRILDAISKEV